MRTPTSARARWQHPAMKTLGVAVAAMLTAATLSSCSSSEPTNEAPSPASSSPSAEETPAAEETTAAADPSETFAYAWRDDPTVMPTLRRASRRMGSIGEQAETNMTAAVRTAYQIEDDFNNLIDVAENVDGSDSALGRQTLHMLHTCSAAYRKMGAALTSLRTGAIKSATNQVYGCNSELGGAADAISAYSE